MTKWCVGICARGALEINRVEEKKMEGGGSLSLSNLFFFGKVACAIRESVQWGYFTKVRRTHWGICVDLRCCAVCSFKAPLYQALNFNTTDLWDWITGRCFKEKPSCQQYLRSLLRQAAVEWWALWACMWYLVHGMLSEPSDEKVRCILCLEIQKMQKLSSVGKHFLPALC